jgi:thymidylate synthase (FAD)
MKIVQPEVELLAITPNGEKLIEEAGRTCYLSLGRITDNSNESFIRNSIRRGHHSILEHASASFRIKGASRSFTHQLVRHRLASFSQQSQRYVDEKEFSFIIPPEIAANEEAAKLFRQHMADTQELYENLRNRGIKKQDARFILPNALESEIVFSSNFRELRAVFKLRLEKSAQWEFRRVALEMLKIMQKEAPAVFSDFIIDEENWTAHSELDPS